MATIRDYIRSNIGETYDKLTDTAGFDGGNTRPDVVGLKIKAALARFGVVEADLNDFGKSYVADHTTRTLVPIAIDYYMVQTRLIDNASRPSGMTTMGGEVGQNYDRIAALRRIDEMLSSRLTADLPLFETQLPGGAAPRMVVADGNDLKTIDPMTFPPGGAPDYEGGEFGVAYVVNAG
jgi:hypothetical protein